MDHEDTKAMKGNAIAFLRALKVLRLRRLATQAGASDQSYPKTHMEEGNGVYGAQSQVDVLRAFVI